MKLQASLDSAQRSAAARLAEVDDPIALSLEVGLPATKALLEHRDLDNYLCPLGRRLAKADRQIVSAWASKRIATSSYLTVDTAQPWEPGPEGPGWTAQMVLTKPVASAAYKEQMRDNLVGLEQLPEGGVAVELSFIVGPAHNWMNLWKPTIDSLGVLLGHDPGTKEWNARDGRIVQLALHCAVDPVGGYQVLLGVRAWPVMVDDFGYPQPDHDLVPFPDLADEWGVIQFALAYSMYDPLGFDEVTATGQAVQRGWESGGYLPKDLPTLRTALFWAQRQHRWVEDQRPFGKVPYVVALIARIRAAAPDGVRRVGPAL